MKLPGGDSGTQALSTLWPWHVALPSSLRGFLCGCVGCIRLVGGPRAKIPVHGSSMCQMDEWLVSLTVPLLGFHVVAIANSEGTGGEVQLYAQEKQGPLRH